MRHLLARMHARTCASTEFLLVSDCRGLYLWRKHYVLLHERSMDWEFLPHFVVISSVCAHYGDTDTPIQRSFPMPKQAAKL